METQRGLCAKIHTLVQGILRYCWERAGERFGVIFRCSGCPQIIEPRVKQRFRSYIDRRVRYDDAGV